MILSLFSIWIMSAIFFLSWLGKWIQIASSSPIMFFFLLWSLIFWSLYLAAQYQQCCWWIRASAVLHHLTLVMGWGWGWGKEDHMISILRCQCVLFSSLLTRAGAGASPTSIGSPDLPGLQLSSPANLPQPQALCPGCLSGKLRVNKPPLLLYLLCYMFISASCHTHQQL